MSNADGCTSLKRSKEDENKLTFDFRLVLCQYAQIEFWIFFFFFLDMCLIVILVFWLADECSVITATQTSLPFCRSYRALQISLGFFGDVWHGGVRRFQTHTKNRFLLLTFSALLCDECLCLVYSLNSLFPCIDSHFPAYRFGGQSTTRKVSRRVSFFLSFSYKRIEMLLSVT